jgi:ankyrin repeat protein
LSALGFALKCDQGQCGPILRIIFAAGTDPNALVDYRLQRNGLQFAVADNRCDLAQFMIAGGADVNFNCPKCYPKTSCGHPSEPPICIAVARGNIEIVKLLLSYNARVNTVDRIGYPLLALAASLGNIALVQTLLDAGAAVNTNGSDFMCPALEDAAMRDSTEILRLLLQAGANASGKGSKRYSSVLCYAAYRGYLDTVRILLEAGATANISGRYNDIDSFHDDEDDETSRENMSAIHFCAAGGSVHMAALLVRWGADVNTRARIGKCCDLRKLQRMRRQGEWLAPLSPLEEAAARGHLDMLQLLLDSGARTHGDGARQYRRALGYARRRCNPAAVKLLKKHHAAEGDVRQSDGFGGVNGLQGGSEVFPWMWEMNSERF